MHMAHTARFMSEERRRKVMGLPPRYPLLFKELEAPFRIRFFRVVVALPHQVQNGILRFHLDDVHLIPLQPLIVGLVHYEVCPFEEQVAVLSGDEVLQGTVYQPVPPSSDVKRGGQA